MKLPHPNDVIMAGRIQARGSQVAAQMLNEFSQIPMHEKAEFLFWSLQQMAAEQQRLISQVNHLIKMLDERGSIEQ